MRYWMFLLGLLMYANVAEAIDCKTPPDCAELGYSKDNDPNCTDDGYMYCPFNHDYKKCVNHDCAKLGFTTSDKSSWCKEIIKCEGNEDYTLCAKLPSCEVGDVFYADGSCGYADDYDASSGKIPVGVVYWVTEDGQHGKVINLHDLSKGESDDKDLALDDPFDPANPYNNASTLFRWSTDSTDIPDVKNWDCDNGGYESTAKTGDHDNEFWSGGKDYTDLIVKTVGETSLQYAAPAVKAFYPPEVSKDDPKFGAGHWYLPTLGELMDLYGYDYPNVSGCMYATTGGNGTTKSTVNATLTTLKNKGITAKALMNDSYFPYLSSSEDKDYDQSWRLNMKNGKRHKDWKRARGYVRASLEF